MGYLYIDRFIRSILISIYSSLNIFNLFICQYLPLYKKYIHHFFVIKLSVTLSNDESVSKVRHENSGMLNPVDIHGYQPPWKALTDFGMQPDMDRLDPNHPSFQHIMSQVKLFRIS